MKYRWYILAFAFGVVIGRATARPVDKKNGTDWERRYAELVETVAQRTDQAKVAK